MKHNILFVTLTNFDPHKGGVGRVTDTITKYFLNKGYRVHYMFLQPIEASYSGLIGICTLPSPDLNDQATIKYYCDYVKEHNIDIVVNQYALYSDNDFLQNAKDVKIISVIHNSPFCAYDHMYYKLTRTIGGGLKNVLRMSVRGLLTFEVKYRIKRALDTHFLQLARTSAKICFLSESYKERIYGEYNIPQSFLCSIPNPNSFSKVPGLLKKEKEVIFVGRLHNESKNIMSLLSIWKKVSPQNTEWKLTIVGDGQDRKMAEEYASTLPNVTFVGFQEPKSYYEKASIFCLTSVFEGFPMCITEAMQYGCVPIAFDSFGALTDIVHDGEDGVIVKAFSENDFAKKLSQIMNDDRLRKELADNARKNISRYDEDKILPMWEKLFDSL